MDNKGYIAIKNLITKYQLKPTTQRNLPLLTQSIITLGYTIYLKQRLGYSYEALAFIGKKNWFHSMMGEEIINHKIRKYLEKNYKNLDKLFLTLLSEFKKIKGKILAAEKMKNKNQSIKIILENYLQFMMVISVYNCFWRYLGNKEQDEFISEQQIKRLSWERDLVAKFYPAVEKIILVTVKEIGKAKHFDGTLLQYLSYLEFKKYLKEEITKEKLMELKKRKAGYFYTFEEKKQKEIIITDQKIIGRIKKEFYDINKKVTKIKGFPAYKGLVQGKVFNISESKKPATKKYILVAPSTHPKDIKLIKDALAIVADEGGILSHAAVISREFKIPCLIGTKFATKLLKNGSWVEVDANKGEVKTIKK